MKKFFTLISVALFAMSAFAQDPEPKKDPDGHYEGIYPVKDVVWKTIKWTNGNNKKDKDEKEMLFLMGTGNGYATMLANYSYSTDKSEWQTKAEYTYIKYEEGETGIPAYGLYYMFTPKVSGKLRVTVWNNKTNRKTFVIKASDGKPLTPYVDYTFDGYVNGQNQPGTSIPIYFTADEIKTRHNEQFVVNEVDTNPYVIDKGNQAVWGWFTLNVVAGESYVIYQQSSQLGFGGYDFTPDGGDKESYVSCADMGGTIAIAPDFANVVDANGNVKAECLSDEGSVVNFGTTNMNVKAVGGAEPESITADFDATGIEAITTVEENVNAPVYNLAGQKVNANAKGLLIKNGKKFMNK